MLVQVLVLDLDHTIVHTPRGPAGQQFLADYPKKGRVFEVSANKQQIFCAPRTYLVNFFCHIYQKYHVMYCTAGSDEYGNAVVKNLQKYMLSTPNLDDRFKKWIMNCTDPRCAPKSVGWVKLLPAMAFSKSVSVSLQPTKCLCQ